MFESKQTWPTKQTFENEKELRYKKCFEML